MLVLLVHETLESRTRLKNNAHVMCDQRGEKKSERKSFDAFLLERSKKEGIFFLRKISSVLFPLQSFREREKEYDDDDDVCEQCEYHWTWHYAHEEHEYSHEREETVSEAKLFHFFRREQ